MPQKHRVFYSESFCLDCVCRMRNDVCVCHVCLQAKRSARSKEASERQERCDATETEAQKMRETLKADDEAEFGPDSDDEGDGKPRVIELGPGGYVIN